MIILANVQTVSYLRVKFVYARKQGKHAVKEPVDLQFSVQPF